MISGKKPLNRRSMIYALLSGAAVSVRIYCKSDMKRIYMHPMHVRTVVVVVVTNNAPSVS